MAHRPVVNLGSIEGMDLGRKTRMIEVGALVRSVRKTTTPKEADHEDAQERLERPELRGGGKLKFG